MMLILNLRGFIFLTLVAFAVMLVLMTLAAILLRMRPDAEVLSFYSFVRAHSGASRFSQALASAPHWAPWLVIASGVLFICGTAAMYTVLNNRETWCEVNDIPAVFMEAHKRAAGLNVSILGEQEDFHLLFMPVHEEEEGTMLLIHLVGDRRALADDIETRMAAIPGVEMLPRQENYADIAEARIMLPADVPAPLSELGTCAVSLLQDVFALSPEDRVRIMCNTYTPCEDVEREEHEAM